MYFSIHLGKKFVFLKSFKHMQSHSLSTYAYHLVYTQNIYTQNVYTPMHALFAVHLY